MEDLLTNCMLSKDLTSFLAQVNNIVTYKFNFKLILIPKQNDLDPNLNIKNNIYFYFRIQETCPECHSLPVSAEAEVILQGQQRSGVIEYHSGDREVKVIKSQTLAQQGEVEKIQQHVLNE